MNLTEYFLLSVLYFWASSTALSFGIGYYTIYRPIISGFLTGLILGNPFLGMTAGAIINVIYIDFVSTGGSLKGDQCLTAMIAAIAAILLKLSPIEASAAAYLFGFLGILIWKYRMSINSVFVKQYEKKYNEDKKENYNDISLYDGFLPQLLLYIMSTAVILTTIITVIFLKDFLLNIKDKLFLAGIFLVLSSVLNILYKINNKKSILVFVFAFIVTISINPKSYLIFLATAVTTWILSYKNLTFVHYNKINNEGILSNKDLIYSWFIWMNFSHSCYSYDRLQGMAFAHSMKNIFKELYLDPKDIASAIHRHSEQFNTEPNIGTPIHGYIISLEEKHLKNNDKNNILFIKKGMMGIAAGLGDSYTQVVITPLFISMSLMLCLDNSYILALVPVIMLAITILSISYTGFMKGYYQGRESLIERINIIKNSKVKKYFPYMFAGILGVSLGKLLMNVTYQGNLTTYTIIGIISFVYVTLKNRSLK